MKTGKPADRGDRIEFPEQMVIDIDIEDVGSEEMQLTKFTGNDRSRRFVSGNKGNAKRKNALKNKVRLKNTCMCSIPND